VHSELRLRTSASGGSVWWFAPDSGTVVLVTTVLLGMGVSVLAALVVLALVAVPRVRSGERLLTPDGEGTVREASRRARALAAQAAGRAGGVAHDVRGRAGAVSADVRERAHQARSRRAEKNHEPAEAAGTSFDPGESPESVIDLRDPAPVSPAPAGRPETPGVRRLRNADLGWGAPRPGPRHGR
jgi:hypothetical protein